MTDDERKAESPLFLNVDFEEALGRFAKVKPEEVKESVDRAKQKNRRGIIPPGGDPKKGGSS